jgi:hypothetical protein
MAEDTVGNILGVRGVFEYNNDSSVKYNISLDRSVSLAIGNGLSTIATLPIIRASGRRPIAPRYLLLQQKGNPAVKKKAIVCDLVNSIFLSSAATEVTINSIVYVVTGRVGERRSTLVIEPVTP